MGNWQVNEVDAKHLAVSTPDDEISHESGIVSFTPDQVCGSRCCYEDVPATRLGPIGSDIVSTFRQKLTAPTISIWQRGFGLCLSLEHEHDEALHFIEELELRHSRQLAGARR